MKATLTALIALLALTACETVKGAGRDIETAGGAISSEASRAQQKM
jgi:predicted small secreted protein